MLEDFDSIKSKIGPPLLLLILGYVAYSISASALFRASEYRDLIGEIEDRTWTQDIQPKDEKHLRLISEDYAIFKAQQILGEAGAIGSQFEIDKDHITLQAIKKELWYIIPIDFSRFLVWTEVDVIPGYIRVHGEDTNRKAEFVRLPSGKRFRYSPGAFIGKNLERHVRMSGYLNSIFADVQLEIDDEENAHWIISLAKATIGWSGKKITGVLLVDPVTGYITPKSIEELPTWVDRVFPASYIKQYLAWHGEYIYGWRNSWYAGNSLTAPEDPNIIYSSEQHPDFVTGITSKSKADTSLLSYVYTDTRTGKTIFYKVNGGSTDSAILKAVNSNQDVQFKHLTGKDPQTYNISGVMTSIVILENDRNIFQGVAFVQVTNVETIGIGESAPEAQLKFQNALSKTGQRVAPEKEHTLKQIKGIVDRVHFEVLNGSSVHYIHVKDIPHLFTGSSSHFSTIPVTEPGDRVEIGYIDSPQEVLSIHGFTNQSLILSKSEPQVAIEKRSAELRDEEEAKEESVTVAETMKGMSVQELQKLNKLLKQTKTPPAESKTK